MTEHDQTTEQAQPDGVVELRNQTSHEVKLASQTGQNVELAAEALLREHPDALVCGLSSNGLIAPIPGAVALWGQDAIEGRAVIDGVVAADRATVVNLWRGVGEGGVVNGKVRMLTQPSRWVTLHFLDLRHVHGVLLCVILPGDEDTEGTGEEAVELPPAAPRFSTLTEDEGGIVLECDDAFTQMFGYTAAELIGNSVLDQIHPEDQGRAVEGWLAMLSTRRDQQTRLRRRRKDGSWVWVDTTLHNYLNQPDCNHVLVEMIDISAEMAAQEALEEREELLRRLTDAMPVGLLQLDTDRRVVYNNSHLLEILHGSADEAPVEAEGEGHVEAKDAPRPAARTVLSTLVEEGMTAFEASLDRVLEEGVDQDIEVDMVLRSGVWRRALLNIRALLRARGEVTGAITCVLDITDSARARQELEKRATFDALTGCHNRSSILASLQRELERDDSPMTGVVYVDLDRFKAVNDTLGHAAGDDLLIVVAERLRIASRAEDDVGRLGGDEFLVLLRCIPDASVAMRVADRISASLGSKFELSSETIELRASVGVACRDSEAITADELVKRADTAMYESKEQGLGRPVLAAGRQSAQPRRVPVQR
jgi:diguanylate cyclase (GGDEF)-like protein/PAS domain S-box-containing protein